ncbi:MAG: prolyl oligopeptidase family serine peptidase [Bacteroidota bacterium]
MKSFFRSQPWLTFLFLFTSILSFSQKKIIDHTAYNDWKKIGEIAISNDGKYSVYTIKPHRGDGFLYLVNNQTQKLDSFPRSVMPKFTSDSKGLIFKISPGFDTLRKCELEKVKKDKWPKDSLGIFYLEKDTLVKIANIKEFSVSKEGGRFAYLSNENKIPKNLTEKSKKKKAKKKKKGTEENESDGKLLVIKEIKSDDYAHIKNVTEYKFSENGEKVAYLSHFNNKVDSTRMWIFNFMETEKLDKESKEWIPTKSSFDFSPTYPSVVSFDFDKAGNQLVYLASQDTIEENKVYQLYHYDYLNSKKSLLVDTLNTNFASNKSVSEHFEPYFSLDGTQIFFGIGEKPIKTPKDTLLENEKAKLDVWNWKDDRLQAQQLVELDRDKKDAFFAVYSLKSNSFLVLENDSMEVSHDENNPSKYVLATNSNPYETKYNWEFPNKQDYYRVNMEDASLTLLEKSSIHGVNLSPSGKYFTYFNTKNSEQYVKDIETQVENCMTCGTKENWWEDLNGMPYVQGPLGVIGWGKGENQVFIQAKNQLYVYNISEKNLIPLISNEKLNEKNRYTINLWNRDSLYIDFENVYVTSFHEKDKSESFYLPKWHDSHLDLIEKISSNHSFYGFIKAKKADQILFQKTNLLDYPDLYTTTWTSNTEAKQLSKTNPQQKEFNWATVDLISWKSYDGVPLEGLLYKPEDYDSTKKYPLLVYFYEMYSDELHNHYAPKPTASIIYPTEYASAGYLVLIPDIRYKAGYPARGAYDCIMSGTDYVLKKYKAADSTRMGLQGQSWGGYQTAQLITMTTRYKAAMAGAPVGNMFSAYGGIRWGSGLNRQFQYEHTQSRIGKTIWEAPELYVENSPLFHLPKVKTPLLIMHNDADGSVPWYQGIELFTGLKRLEKPVWMLNYNGDDHNLMKNANRIDLSIRMRQFFDYYLLDKPAPIWLIDGVPAVDKGKNYGLDLK